MQETQEQVEDDPGGDQPRLARGLAERGPAVARGQHEARDQVDQGRECAEQSRAEQTEEDEEGRHAARRDKTREEQQSAPREERDQDHDDEQCASADCTAQFDRHNGILRPWICTRAHQYRLSYY